MQALFPIATYASTNMAAHAGEPSRLRMLREAAGLTLRELARRIEEQPSNINYWETSGNLPRSNVLIPYAKALGVSVEELLGQAKPQRVSPGGRLGQLVESISKLPRRQQQKIIDTLDTLLAGQNARQQINEYRKAA